MQKPKLLLFTDWYLPGFKAGGPIQSCKNLVGLLKDTYQIFILTSDRDLCEPAPYPDVVVNQWTTIHDSVNIFYASPEKINKRFLKELFAEIQPEYIYLNSMYSFKFTILPVMAYGNYQNQPKIVLAPRGMLQDGAVQYKKLKKIIFLNITRLLGWGKKIHFHATDAQEVQDVMKYYPKAAVSMVQNIPNYSFETNNQTAKQPGELKLVFLSRISPKKNLHSAIKWLKEKQLPFKWSFDIYGGIEDQAYFEELKTLSEGIPVNFKGPIDNKLVNETLQRYHCFVLPTFAENFGHAIFEALCAGLPVILSYNTPWLQLKEKKAGINIDIDAPAEYIQALEFFAGLNEAAFEQWRAGAKKMAKDYVDSGNYLMKYTELFSKKK
jgi:glycosyltransferase involved in cell wall biosynthesis